MKNIAILGACITLIFSSSINAQDKSDEKMIKKEVSVEVNDEGNSPQYKVKVVTDKDGKKEVVERTYKSLEELEADTTISVMKSKKGNQQNFSFTFDEESEGREHVMMFNGDDGNTFTIKLDGEGEGNEQVMTFNSDDGNTFTIKLDDEGEKTINTSGGKMVMFIDEDGDVSQFSSEGDSSRIIKKYEIQMEMADDDDLTQMHKNVMVIKADDGQFNMNQKDGNDNVMVWVDEKGNKTVKKTVKVKSTKSAISSASIEEIGLDNEDWSSFNLGNFPVLSLKSINYYPNPNEGEFTLAFSGSKKPVTVRILDSKGNLEFESKIEEFDGNYNEVINLKGLNKGSYLMQIFQQGKALNKQIILK